MTTAPKSPQDHKKPAAQLEAEGEPKTVVGWRGHEFTVPSDPDDWTVETTLAFEEGKPASAVRGVLGPTQWAVVMKERPRNRDLGELFNAIAAALGLDSAGE